MKGINKISSDQVEHAMHSIENNILNEESYSLRPQLLGTNFFDEFTSSNCESEHAALKKASLGMTATQKVSTLFQKANMDAQKRYQSRLINETKDITRTVISTKCNISNIIVKSCFEELKKRIDLSTYCVSKHVDRLNWIVIYQGYKTYNTDLKLHFLPRIQRKRYVTLNKGE